MFRNTNSTMSTPNLGALRQTEPNVCPSSFASQRPTTVHHRGDYHDTAISSQTDVVPGVHAIHESDMEYPIQIGLLPTEVSNDLTGADSSALDGRHDPNSGTGLLNELLLAPVESGPVILSVTSIPGSGPEEDAPIMDDITSDMDEVEIVIKSEDNDESSATAVSLPRSSQEMFQQTQGSICGDQLVRRVNSNQERRGTIRTLVSEGSQRTSNHADRASHARDSGQQAMSSGSQQRRTDDDIQRQQGHRVASEEQRVINANSFHVGQNDVSRESRSGNDGRSGQISSKRKESSTKSKATASDSAPEANNPRASGSIGAGRGRDRGHSEKLHSSLEEEKKARLDILRYQAMKALEEAEQARCRRELIEVELASAKQQMELSRLRQEAEIELIRQQVRQEKAKADKMTASQASSSNS
ncbi:uncharacterized protein [Diadema antillarum]|uniref:uncharacterized protein n=1 Tax=Diadema antillarum TaxID=105358 RepID=UPI003A86299B